MQPGRGRGRPPRTELFERFRHNMEDMTKRFGGLPSRFESDALWRDIWREDAHNSTAIEGNTLVQREVDQLLEQGMTGSTSKALADYLIVIGYADAARWVYERGIDPSGSWSTGDLLTLTEVREVHHMAMSPVWQFSPPDDALPEEKPGAFRQHEIEPFGSGHQPPSPPLIASEMDLWLKQVNGLREQDPYPIEIVAELHAQFERVHPFLDGNGRTGRLLLNLVLVRLGMPPAIIYKAKREAYITAMKRSDAGDCGSLAEMLARAVLYNFERLMLPKLAGEARLVPISSLATEDVTHSALRSAATRGALKAQQNSVGQWLSTKSYVDEYIAQRNTARGRPKLQDPHAPVRP
jgi:hypothetical protein